MGSTPLPALPPIPQSLPFPENARLRQAAQDFESILLHSWWQSMRESFFDSSGAEGESSGEILGDWGLQVMSSAIAASGGLGLSRLLLRQWELEPISGATGASTENRLSGVSREPVAGSLERLGRDPQVFSAVAD